MGRYIRKCKASGPVGEMTVMEVTQVVGVRTRSRAIKAAASVPKSTAFKDQADVQLEAYLELRSRRLFIAPRIARTTVNSCARRCSMSELEGSGVVPSHCSSSSSVNGAKVEEDAAERLYLRSGDAEVACDQESLVGNSECNTQRRELTPSSEYKLGEVSDLESETSEKSRCTSPVDDNKMPSQSEMDEFFAVAEKAVRDRFASKYNFDVEKEVALEGRYDWVKLK